MKYRAGAIALTLTLLFSPVVATHAASWDLYIGWPGPGSWTTLPYVVAGEKGFFEKGGVKVRLIAFRGNNLMLAALLAGEIDFGTFLPFFAGSAARGLPVRIVGSVTKSSGYSMVSRPEIQSIVGLRGKKIGINSFGSSADYAAYVALSRNGLDPNKDATFLAVGGGTQERLAALASGSVDATVLTSPLEYNAEKQGFKILVPMHEMSKLARIPVTGVATSMKKIEKEPDEIVRVLRALRLSTLLIQSRSEYGVAVFEKILRLDGASAEKFYHLFRDQYNPELSLPDAVVEDLLAVGTFRSKEKDRALANAQAVGDWSFAEKARR